MIAQHSDWMFKVCEVFFLQPAVDYKLSLLSLRQSVVFYIFPIFGRAQRSSGLSSLMLLSSTFINQIYELTRDRFTHRCDNSGKTKSCIKTLYSIICKYSVHMSKRTQHYVTNFAKKFNNFLLSCEINRIKETAHISINQDYPRLQQ